MPAVSYCLLAQELVTREYSSCVVGWRVKTPPREEPLPAWCYGLQLWAVKCVHCNCVWSNKSSCQSNTPSYIVATYARQYLLIFFQNNLLEMSHTSVLAHKIDGNTFWTHSHVHNIAFQHPVARSCVHSGSGFVRLSCNSSITIKVYKV
jgi:hypothetical protein